MKKNNKKTFSLLTVLLAVLAVCLLVVGGIGVTRAVLIESDTYSGTLETPDIAVQLNENGKAVSGEDALLQDLLDGEESLAIGKHYDEVLTVTNTGTADQFVRVTLYKYWTDDEGKRVDLDTDYIGLVLGEDWLEDKSATTDERVVLYYPDKLSPDKGKNETTPLLKEIYADGDLALYVTETTVTEGTHTTITSTYKYNGLNLNLEASVDAIQTHHAQDAIEASWGTTNVTADEDAGTLSVIN